MSLYLAMPLLIAGVLGGQLSAQDTQIESTHAQPAHDSPPPPPPGSQETIVAGLLDHGMWLGDPFPARDAMPAIPSAANTRKARSVVRLAQVARDRGLDHSPDLVQARDATEQMLLAEKLMQTLSDAIVVNDSEIRAIYDRHPDKYDEFELSHIFLSSEGGTIDGAGDKQALTRAEAAQAKLKSGASFESVAETSSDDTSSSAQGGALPAVLGGNILPMFLEAVHGLKPGEISGIVKGEHGYHIVKLVKRTHDLTGPPQDLIRREIKAREMQKLLPELRRLEDGVK